MGTGGHLSKGMHAATIQEQLLFLKFQMWLLFKDQLFKGGYYLGCSFYLNKYGVTTTLKIIVRGGQSEREKLLTILRFAPSYACSSVFLTIFASRVLFTGVQNRWFSQRWVFVDNSPPSFSDHLFLSL